MRTAYRGLAHAISLGVVLQAGWIALAFFGVLADLDEGGRPGADENLGQRLHAGFGTGLLPLLAVALLLVSLRAGVPGGTRRAALVVAVVAVQVALAYLAQAWTPVGVLHGIGAFAVIGVAELAAHRARHDRAATEPFTVAERTTR
jgi:hypothetical protein